MPTMFIDSGLNLKKDDKDLVHFAEMRREDLVSRWNTPDGQEIMSNLIKHKFSEDSIQQIGRLYDQHDLRGIDLSGKNLTNISLNNIDFFYSNLENADFSKSSLVNTHLSECNIINTKFDWAQMDRVLIDNVKYNTGTSFNGVNIGAINFTLASLLQDLAISQQRILHLESKSPKLAFFLRITSDYGRSLSRWSFWCLGIILLFTLLYEIPNSISSKGLFENLYFSIITFTTLGYGDILPVSLLGHVLCILEVCLGYLMGGLLIAILTKKVMGN